MVSRTSVGARCGGACARGATSAAAKVGLNSKHVGGSVITIQAAESPIGFKSRGDGVVAIVGHVSCADQHLWDGAAEKDRVYLIVILVKCTVKQVRATSWGAVVITVGLVIGIELTSVVILGIIVVCIGRVVFKKKWEERK